MQGPAVAKRQVRWRVVVAVAVSMVIADANGIVTGPWLSGELSPAGMRLLDFKEAWNHAIFFGLVAGVTAWRLNNTGRNDVVQALDFRLVQRRL
jgi:hypothetical protein